MIELSLEQQVSEVKKQWEEALKTIKALEAVTDELNQTIQVKNKTIERLNEDLKEVKADNKDLKLHYVEFNEFHTKHLESKKLELFYMTQKAFYLSEAFRKYGAHLRYCKHPEELCTCGLQDLELEGVKINGLLYRIGYESKQV